MTPKEIRGTLLLAGYTETDIAVEVGVTRQAVNKTINGGPSKHLRNRVFYILKSNLPRIKDSIAELEKCETESAIWPDAA